MDGQDLRFFLNMHHALPPFWHIGDENSLQETLWCKDNKIVLTVYNENTSVNEVIAKRLLIVLETFS